MGDGMKLLLQYCILYIKGSFDIVLSSFAFVRRVGYYILQLYVPTAMLVGLSWTMFCLNHDHTGDRITIGVTLFLTMMFLHGYANTSLPRVSYVKMVDLFMVVSLGEILIITVESIVISKLHDRFIDQEENKHAGTHVKKALRKVSNFYSTLFNNRTRFCIVCVPFHSLKTICIYMGYLWCMCNVA